MSRKNNVFMCVFFFFEIKFQSDIVFCVVQKRGYELDIKSSRKKSLPINHWTLSVNGIFSFIHHKDKSNINSRKKTTTDDDRKRKSKTIYRDNANDEIITGYSIATV